MAKIRLVVVNENAFCYITPEQPQYASILHGSILRGYTGNGWDSILISGNIRKTFTCSFMLAHNHPSGNIAPSAADLRLTSRISNAAKVLDIAFLDHLIISSEKYYSLSDNCQMFF